MSAFQHQLSNLNPLKLKLFVDDSEYPELKTKYKEHIERFKGLPFLTERMISEIKDFKKAYYVLGNSNRKTLYDNRFKKKNTMYQMSELNEDFTENTKINDRLFGNIFNK